MRKQTTSVQHPDAATRWISPHWLSDHQLLVHVLNPNDADANVIAYWYENGGDLLRTYEETVPAGERRNLWPPSWQGGSHPYGWLRIVSDLPVVPWGTTSFSWGETVYGNESMTFYREEAEEEPRAIDLPDTTAQTPIVLRVRRADC